MRLDETSVNSNIENTSVYGLDSQNQPFRKDLFLLYASNSCKCPSDRPIESFVRVYELPVIERVKYGVQGRVGITHRKGNVDQLLRGAKEARDTQIADDADDAERYPA